MRLTQTVLTALVATTATALPVTEKQPQVGDGQQHQQVLPDHDRVQAQKIGGLEETVRKQPLGYSDKELPPRSGDKQWENVNPDKKNPGSFNGLFTTNGQETQGWAKIKSAFLRGGLKQDDNLDYRRPLKGEFTGGNRQHGSNGVLQARHDPNEVSLLEKMRDGDRQSRFESGGMGFVGHDQYDDKTLRRPFNSEYVVPRGFKKGDGMQEEYMMPLDTTVPNPEREDWMRQGEGGMLSKYRDQEQNMDKEFTSDYRQGNYKSGFVKGLKESRVFSPMTQNWILRVNSDVTESVKTPTDSSDEQIAGTIQMTFVDGRIPEQQQQEVPNTHVKQIRMVPNRLPHTYDSEMRRPVGQDDEQFGGQYNQYRNKGQPTNDQRYEDYYRQPSSGETKEYLSFLPNGGETKDYKAQLGRTQMDMNQPNGMHGHTTEDVQKDSNFPVGEFQTTPSMLQKTNYRVSPSNGNLQRRNRHTGTQNSQVLPPSDEMSREGTRVPVDEVSKKPSHTETEYTRGQTWMEEQKMQRENYLLNKDLKPTDNMVKGNLVVEPREMLLTYEQGHKDSMSENSNLNCDAEDSILCKTSTKGRPSGTMTEMMKTVGKEGPVDTVGKEVLVDSQSQLQGHDQVDKSFFSFMERNPTKVNN